MGKDTRQSQKRAVRRHYDKHKVKLNAHKREIEQKKRESIRRKFGEWTKELSEKVGAI